MRKIIYTLIFVLGMHANVYTAPTVPAGQPEMPDDSGRVTVRSATSKAVHLSLKENVRNILSYLDTEPVGDCPLSDLL